MNEPLRATPAGDAASNLAGSGHGRQGIEGAVKMAGSRRRSRMFPSQMVTVAAILSDTQASRGPQCRFQARPMEDISVCSKACAFHRSAEFRGNARAGTGGRPAISTKVGPHSSKRAAFGHRAAAARAARWTFREPCAAARARAPQSDDRGRDLPEAITPARCRESPSAARRSACPQLRRPAPPPRVGRYPAVRG